MADIRGWSTTGLLDFPSYLALWQQADVLYSLCSTSPEIGARRIRSTSSWEAFQRDLIPIFTIFAYVHR